MVFDRVVKIQEWWPREFSLNCFLSHIPRSIFLRFSMFERSLWLIHSYRQGSDLDRNRIDVRKETRLTSTDFSAFKICFRLFSVFDLTNPNFYTFSLSSSVGAKTESRTIKLPKSNNLPISIALGAKLWTIVQVWLIFSRNQASNFEYFLIMGLSFVQN